MPGQSGSTRVAVIGGGAAGTLAAVRLLGSAKDVEVLQFERHLPGMARGIAYSTREAGHLLNVRAQGMSAFPEEPQHFAEWLAARRTIGVDEAKHLFAQRYEFGDYLAELLEKAPKTRYHLIGREITTLSFDGQWTLGSREGKEERADAVILACGAPPPERPSTLSSWISHPNVVVNPWTQDWSSRVHRDDSVLIIGTGLTMIDAVMSLTAKGRRGPIHAISRRGTLPHPHAASDPVTPPKGPHSRAALYAFFRDAGANWRAALDSIRPETAQIWQSMPWCERKRFINRLRPYWDRHRHRMPAEIAAQLQVLADEGSLVIHKGCIATVSRSCERFKATLKDGSSIEADWIVNCTGPSMNLRAAKMPLIESLVRQELASYDPLDLGLEVDNQNRTIASESLYVIGSLCRGCLWETTAIPEIRAQAARVTQAILDPYQPQ